MDDGLGDFFIWDEDGFGGKINNTILVSVTVTEMIYTVPSFITIISNDCFNKSSEKLHVVKLFDNSELKIIKERSFMNCALLDSINLENCKKLITIECSAFNGCMSLTSIQLPTSLSFLGFSSFANCLNLVEVNQDENNKLNCIQSTAFENTSITSFYFGKHLYHIDSSVFPLNQIHKIDIHQENIIFVLLENILIKQSDVMMSIANDNDILWIPDGVYRIHDRAFKNNTNYKIVMMAPTVVEICNEAFQNSMVEEIQFYDCNLTSIGYRCFMESKLKSINLTCFSWLTQIGEEAFKDCKDLATLGAPPSLNYLHESTFEGCNKLSQIYGEFTELFRIRKGAFAYTNLSTFVVPPHLELIEHETFKGTPIISYVVHPQNEDYIVIDGVLFSKNMDSIKNYPSMNTRSVYKIPEGVFSIRTGAFMDAIFLEKIIFPSTLLSILSYAISNTSITSLSFQSAVSFVSEASFANNQKLISANLSTTIKVLPKMLFENCTSLQSVILSQSITKIRKNSFGGCSSIQCISGASKLIKSVEDRHLIPMFRPTCPLYHNNIVELPSLNVNSKSNLFLTVI